MLIIIAIIAATVSLLLALSSPWHAPRHEHAFDVTRRRNPSLPRLTDAWLCQPVNRSILEREHEESVAWERECRGRAERIRFRPLRWLRLRQLERAARRPAWRFTLTRTHAARRQGRKTESVETVQAQEWDWERLTTRVRQLELIGMDGIMNAEFSREQRRLMTPALRRKVLERDGYVCQKCGKPLPGGRGAHIDHIRPVARGGRTELTNLQALCARCNESKGAKWDGDGDTLGGEDA